VCNFTEKVKNAVKMRFASERIDRDTDVPVVVLDWWLTLARMSVGKRQRRVYLTVAEKKIDKWIL
jgi:hypothetical protein